MSFSPFLCPFGVVFTNASSSSFLSFLSFAFLSAPAGTAAATVTLADLAAILASLSSRLASFFAEIRAALPLAWQHERADHVPALLEFGLGALPIASGALASSVASDMALANLGYKRGRNVDLGVKVGVTSLYSEATRKCIQNKRRRVNPCDFPDALGVSRRLR